MQSKVEKLADSKVCLTVEVSPEDFQKYIDEAFLELSANVAVPGFRPGKAPRPVLEEKIGKQKILAEAIEHAIPHEYFEAAKQSDIETIGRPEIQVLKLAEGNPFIFSATVSVVPDVELGDYQSIKAERKKVEVPKGQLEEVLESLKKRSAKVTEVARPAKTGDRVEVDIDGEVEGVKSEKLTSKNHPLILGEGAMLPLFEENISGMAKNETKEFPLVFPADYRDAGMAGKTAKMTVKLNTVQEINLPEFDAEFAKNWGADSMEQLKERITKDLQKEAQNKEEQEYRVEVVKAAAERAKVDIPEFLVEEELRAMLDETKRGVERQGLPFEKYLEHLKKTEEDLKKEWQEQARERVKVSLVLRAVRNAEKVNATEAEIDGEIEHLAKHQPGSMATDSSQEEAIRKELAKPEGREYIANVVANKKTIDKLVEYASQTS